MQTNEIDGIISLLYTNNIVIIDMLVNSASVTHETIIMALNKMYASGKLLENFNFIVKIINLIESFDDDLLLHLLLKNLVWLYANYSTKNSIEFQNYFKRMSGLCTFIEITSEWTYLPADLFFYHVTNNATHITTNIVLAAISNNCNKEIQNWIVDNWILLSAQSSVKDICNITIHAYRRQNIIIFEKLMQIIYDRSLNDILMINILMFSPIDDRCSEYLLDCKYRNEILFYKVVVDLGYARFHKFDPVSESDRIKYCVKYDISYGIRINNLGSFIESNDIGKKMYDYIYCTNMYEIYDNFDEIISQITSLMEIFDQ